MRFAPILSLLAIAQSALHWKTHDISSLLVEEKKKVTYKSSSGAIQPLEQILKAGGANSVKIRLWVDPPSGEYNLEYGLRLGRRAKEAGLAVVINFHYSDTWADPGHQIKPKKWEGLSTDALIGKVRSYTKDTLDAFAAVSIESSSISFVEELG
jgi:arabinogalactan endo-1,4-beta-galactosidase